MHVSVCKAHTECSQEPTHQFSSYRASLWLPQASSKEECRNTHVQSCNLKSNSSWSKFDYYCCLLTPKSVSLRSYSFPEINKFYGFKSACIIPFSWITKSAEQIWRKNLQILSSPSSHIKLGHCDLPLLAPCFTTSCIFLRRSRY